MHLDFHTAKLIVSYHPKSMSVGMFVCLDRSRNQVLSHDGKFG
jgi:hypothetical protein